MRYTRTVLAGIGYELPPETITSAAIEDHLAPLYTRLGLAPGRLELMSGVRARRAWPAGTRPSEVAARAGDAALARAGLARSAIGCLIHASVCRDFLEPATANLVHHSLGLPARCQVFDLSNACLGVLNGVLLAAELIEAGRIEAALVVSGEIGRPLLDATLAALLADSAHTRRTIKSSFASLTIGSAAAAVVVARAERAPGGARLLGAVARAATEHHALCRGGAPGHADTGLADGTGVLMSTDSEALLAAGVELARATWVELCAELSWRPGEVERIITHQVGRAHHQAMLQALELPAERAFTTYEELGNVGSAALPLSLGLAADGGFLTRGQRVALLGIGSGLNSVMAGVQW